MIEHLSRRLAIKSLGDDGYFVGYASVFDTVDSQNEVVAPGAFQRTLEAWSRKNAAPAMLWMHDPTVPIGLWLSLAEDSRGLVVHGKLALSTQKGREAYELLKLKALTGLSIGYKIVSSQIDRKRKVRVLTDVELFEISLVTFPSNDAARISGVKTPLRGAVPKKIVIDKEATKRVVNRLNRAAAKLRER